VLTGAIPPFGEQIGPPPKHYHNIITVAALHTPYLRRVLCLPATRTSTHSTQDDQKPPVIVTPDLIIQQRVYQKSAVCEWSEAASDWYAGWNITERYWRCHWPLAQTSPCLHSSPEMDIS